MKLSFLAAILLSLSAVPTWGANFLVSNISDGGPGSLRQAIIDANANAGLDTINFNLGSGARTIFPQSPLPPITDPVLIDGYSQPGASPNTLEVGNDAELIIELSGSAAGPGTVGLLIAAGGSTVRGLVINRFAGAGIHLSNNPGNVIGGNFIGTDATGTAGQGNGTGIFLSQSSGNQIGGSSPAARNLISRNTGEGIDTFISSNNVIQGNYIGTDVTGTAALNASTGAAAINLAPQSDNNRIGGTGVGPRNVISGNRSSAIVMRGTIGTIVEGNYIGTDVTGTVVLGNNLDQQSNCAVCILGGRNPSGSGGGPATDNRIGGTALGAGNVIAGYLGPGGGGGAAVFLGGTSVGDPRMADANLVQGNFIGTDVTGAIALGNDGHGVHVQDGSNNDIGGPSPGAGNIIAHSRMLGSFGGSGVIVSSGTGNAILGNAIYNNQKLGIDLSSGGANPVTQNDLDDPDTGPNNLQNFPILASAVPSGGNVQIKGNLNSLPNADYRIEFFGNNALNPSGFGEGQSFLGVTTVTTAGNGNASFDVTLPMAAGQRVTATATDLDLNTSEFSPPPPLPLITSPRFANRRQGRLFVYQFETIHATSLAVNDLAPGLTFNTTLRAIVGRPTTPGTYQIELSASNAQGTTTATLNLTVIAPPGNDPEITSNTSATGRVGQPFRFQVITTGASAAARITATDLPPGLSIDSVTGRISGTPTTEGDYNVTLTVTDGNATASETLQLTFSADLARPIIISANEVTLVPGQPFTYTLIAPSTSDPSEQTIFDLIGDLPQGLTFDPITGTISGTFTTTVASTQAARANEFADILANQTDPGGGGIEPLSGGVVSNVQLFASNSNGTGTFPLVFYLAPSGVVNIATRLAIGTEGNVLIAGFILTGNAPKKLIIRAIAPSLRIGDDPVPGTLVDPTLDLRNQAGDPLGFNDDWRDSQEQEIIDTSIPPSHERESAIIATLNPGAYTSIVRGQDDGTGIGLVEVYDLGTASLESSSNSKLGNISTRGFVQGDDNVMIGGFIIANAPTKVVVRAIGPTLIFAGVFDALADPILDLHNGQGDLIFANNDWKDTQRAELEATTIPPSNDLESAIVATLPPGPYTAIVRGKSNTTGVGLVEVYNLQ